MKYKDTKRRVWFVLNKKAAPKSQGAAKKSVTMRKSKNQTLLEWVTNGAKIFPKLEFAHFFCL